MLEQVSSVCTCLKRPFYLGTNLRACKGGCLKVEPHQAINDSTGTYSWHRTGVLTLKPISSKTNTIWHRAIKSYTSTYFFLRSFHMSPSPTPNVGIAPNPSLFWYSVLSKSLPYEQQTTNKLEHLRNIRQLVVIFEHQGMLEAQPADCPSGSCVSFCCSTCSFWNLCLCQVVKCQQNTLCI